MKRCPSCGEENADRARFCHACATPFPSVEPTAEVRKVVTIVFVVVTGSTALGERLDPEALRRVSDRLWEEIGNPCLEANRWQSRGERLTYLGRYEDAERSFRRGVETFDTLGETGFNSTMTALHATALCSLGRSVEAEAEAARSRDLSAEDDFASQVAWCRAQAWVSSARGDHDGALRLVDEESAIVEATDYLVFRADTAAIRGLVLRGAGRHAEAREGYGKALELYERKGAVPLVARVREDLATLDGA